MARSSSSETQFDIDLHFKRAQDLFEEFDKHKNRNPLESGIENAEEVVCHAPKGSEESLTMTWKLARYISKRGYVRDGVPVDLDRSVGLFNAYLEEAPDAHCKRPHVCYLLSEVLENRFKYSSNREGLDEAVRLAYKAAELSELDPTHHLKYLRTIHKRLQAVFLSFREPETLDAIVLARRKALEESIKRDEAYRWWDMHAVERSLSQRFEDTGNIADLQEALELAKAACKSAPDVNTHRCQLFYYCANVLVTSYHAGALPLSALDESTEMLQSALEMCPAGSDGRPGIFIQLSNCNTEAYRRGRDVQLLYLGIDYGRQAVAEASPDHLERPNCYQCLGTALKELFDYSGKRSILDEAIETYRTALNLPDPRNCYSGLIAANIAFALQVRYEVSGAAADIEEAVAKARYSASWASDRNSQRAKSLNELGVSLTSLYHRFGRLEDLNEAIDCAREAGATASWSLPDRGMYLSNLSTFLSTRYRRTHVDKDLSESLVLARKAIEVTPKSEWQRYAKFASNLASRLNSDYLRTAESERDITKLEEAIAWSQVALDCVPKSHTDWSSYSYELSERQLKFVAHSSNVEKQRALLDRSIETFKEASISESATPMERLGAARTAATLMMFGRRWTEANELSTMTIALLSHVSLRSMVRQDMQHRLSGLSNLSTYGAVASLNSGNEPEEALTLLEMGRGIISGFFIGNRADLSDLHSINPEISSQYEEIRDQLTQMAISQSYRGDVVRHRQELTERLTSLEGQIRELPGLSRFQLPASGDDLKELALKGPLVNFNVTSFRSDAFIVTSQSIVVIPLPNLHENDLEENVQKIIGRSRLTKCTLVERSTSNKHLAKILVWLWEVAVKPVMDHLGLTGTSTSDLPRLWWVTSGLMGLMPLHAAGSGWDETTENTASRCVSSYVHTMKALAYSRERVNRPNRSVPDSILAVHTPHTTEKGWADLNTTPEMSVITNAAARANLACTVLDSPTVPSVTDAMRHSAIVHLACHGDPSFDNPSQTSLVLRGDPTTPDGRMTVNQLFDETHQHAQLAYLSACCTAQQYSKGLIDEGIHLGSVFQLMGFPAVVATLWEADDGAAMELAGAFYRRLLAGGGGLGEMEEGRVARALHGAVAELRAQRLGRRKRKAEDVLAWAPFVHIGI